MAIIAGMADAELDRVNPRACPLLGLAADRGSHFTYAHPGHRCFASRRPTTPDARHQSAYCLGGPFEECDRYRHRSAAGDPSRPPTVAAARFSQHGRAPASSPALVTAAIAQRRLLWRDGPAALLLVGVLGILIYALVARPGTQRAGGVLGAVSSTGSPQPTATAIPSATATDTPPPSNAATSTPLPTRTANPSPVVITPPPASSLPLSAP